MKLPCLLALACTALLPATARADNAVLYPLTTCVVSGEKLGEMGKPVVIIHQGTEVRFCCNDCADTFRKNPAKYLAKLQSPPKS